jgi:DNA-directed RNA polymerase subunit RPC12/RpoP
MEYKSELQKIQEIRKKVFRIDGLSIVVIVLAIVVQSFVPFAAPILGVMLFLHFYKKMEYAAHYPCPRCGEPFGTNSKIVLGLGADKCQHCGLRLD